MVWFWAACFVDVGVERASLSILEMSGVYGALVLASVRSIHRRCLRFEAIDYIALEGAMEIPAQEGATGGLYLPDRTRKARWHLSCSRKEQWVGSRTHLVRTKRLGGKHEDSLKR